MDIISMSWSIDSGSSKIEGLNCALKEAVDKKIVMFCSSIDEGPMVDGNTYPGRTGHCIKIRASTGDGARLSWVSAKNSDFLLPGDEFVHVKRQNGQSGSGSRLGYASEVPAGGSSISTALAAGLAGVLIYCDRLTRSSMAPSESAIGFNDLQSLATMRRAFKTIAAKSEDHKFLRVWKFVPLHWESPVRPGAVVDSRGAKSVKHDLKCNIDSHPKDTEGTRKVLMESGREVTGGDGLGAPGGEGVDIS
ncbi:hypothetical protein QBC32DRAFT_6548 [Pseudoneurospora amorphoporcata]|uniref:Peptidase S8/S53 domain-containing protein n=1 Tax=Pseudoneurospora amorphoporcata TaxID=241081 RepID=A0AAN6NRR7_9PEZI|nr:hypothetical protein QBC32DRAFT_6548 [Pseudoneurospora amorphoporcata]